MSIILLTTQDSSVLGLTPAYHCVISWGYTFEDTIAIAAQPKIKMRRY